MALQYEQQIGSNTSSERGSTSHEPFECFKEKAPCDAAGYSATILPSDGTVIDGSDVEPHSMEEKKFSSPVVHVEEDSVEGEAKEIELGGFFLEDALSNEILPPDILKLQKQEKFKKLFERKNLEKLDGIWKKVGTFHDYLDD